MKPLHILLAAAALAACLSCGQNSSLQTEVRDYADSTAHSYLTLHAELPVPADAASKAIRGKLEAPPQKKKWYQRFKKS